jgi:alkyl sulfatase BDS1-like metallo-beta-lactamase superfamily hydrolase
VVRALRQAAAGLDGPGAASRYLKVDLVMSDTNEPFAPWIENAALHHKKAAPVVYADATLTLAEAIFIKMMAGTAEVKDALLSDGLNVTSSKIEYGALSHADRQGAWNLRECHQGRPHANRLLKTPMK